ncbi:MAG: glycosyltransferase family 2 protein [Lachnospiraceae bacterium]|nr:glycosyltransferase family 2 protein [Lachnospiraceae bacterium]
MEKISFIIPCYRSEKTLAKVVQEIGDEMARIEKYEYEIVLVNDSSPDHTLSTIQELVQSDERITGIDMTKNFGQHAALMAGFHFVTGDIVICLDDDGQTPPSEAHKLIEKIEEGYDAVYAKYEKKEHSLFRNFGSKMNSFMAEEMLNKPKDLYISSYFAVRRVIVDEILRYQNPFPYVIGLVLRSTNKVCNVVVEHHAREEGRSGYSLGKLIGLWMNGFTAFSVKPLRIATYAGFFIALAGFVSMILVLIIKLSYNPDTPLGWASTMAAILIVGGANLLVLGMVGEYIGRIYICLNNSPQYVIRKVIKKEEL